MNDKTERLLQELASKLGVTVDYLWAVLVRGNRVEGAICAGFVVVGLIAVYAGFRSIKYALKDEDNPESFMVGGVLLSIAGLGGALMCFYWAVMDIFCPEYGALADILSHLGK